jgi:ubiquinone/menaquinone biosynthesis C-methylase UbiE
MEIQEAVRDRYARAAKEMKGASGCGCGSDCCGSTASDVVGCGPTGVDEYATEEVAQLGMSLGLSLGCGNPTALADLHPGETVVDLGSGAGLDVLLSAKRVSPGGHAYGVDMTDEMLALANENKDKAGVENVTFLKGTIESVPLPDASVDVIISNCVINLAADKRAVMREAFRLLRAGGRFAVSDMVEVETLAPEVKAQLDKWAGCVAGTIPVDDYLQALRDAGFNEVSAEITHLYTPAEAGLPDGKGKIASAYIRARKPISSSKAA